MYTWKKANELMKVGLDAEVSGSVGAYAIDALNDGVRVAPKVNQKPPKVPKTTNGKVFPRTNSRSAPRIMSRPPKK